MSDGAPRADRAWIEVEAAFESTPDDWSLFADAFARFGCSSSVQVDDPPALKGYLEDVAGAEQQSQALKVELLNLGAPKVRLSSVPDEDWSEVWKAFFKPQRIGKRIVVVPSWESFEPHPDEIVVDLDPGQAFGTGEHPTTKLCLELLESTPLQGRTALDLGCGSGILAIAMGKLGATSVAGSDIESSAVEIARGNAARNGVEVELHTGAGFDAWPGDCRWDVIASNIISVVLIRLADEVSHRLRSGGVWVLSGVLQSNWPDVLAAAEASGFELDAVSIQDDWVGARLRKRETLA